MEHSNLKTRLIERLKEELHDVDVYGHLYEDLKSKGSSKEASYVERIARDEFSHAIAIEQILHNLGYSTDDCAELQDLWHTAKANFDEFKT